MRESYFKIDNEYMFISHNKIISDRTTLLFVHGLGDSGLTFEPMFTDNRFRDFNIVVPDLVGYGRSSQSLRTGGYSFSAHLDRLWRLIKSKGLYKLILVGHSMGGDITTLLCQSDNMSLVKKYVNIEGDVTQHDLFVSSKVAEAHARGNFNSWFSDVFLNDEVYEQYGTKQSGRDYYASVRFCRKAALIENAKELVKRNTALPGKYKSEIGKIYCDLDVPKVYCYGTESLSKESLNFLKENNQVAKEFPGTGHSPMTDKLDEFYDFLYEYITE